MKSKTRLYKMKFQGAFFTPFFLNYGAILRSEPFKGRLCVYIAPFFLTFFLHNFFILQ